MMTIQRFAQLAQADAASSATPPPERFYRFPVICRAWFGMLLANASPSSARTGLDTAALAVG